MQVETIRIVLAEQKSIAGIIRNLGYVLLEGICPENVTGGDIAKAIQFGQITVESKKEEKAEGSG